MFGMYDNYYSGRLPVISDIGFYNSNIVRPGQSVSFIHTVTDWQIELFTENGGTSVINGTEVQNEIGNILIVPSGSFRKSVMPLKCYYIHLSPFCGLYLDLFTKLPYIINVTDEKPLYEMFKQMIYLYHSKNPQDSLKLNSLLSDFYCRLFAHLNETSSGKFDVNKGNIVANNNEKLIEKAVGFINENCSKNISLADIAAFVNLSPVYFHKKFTEAKKMTPHEFLCRKRIEHIKYLLLSGDMPLQQIAYDCGYSSQSYFNCFFKSRTGMTPGEFRIIESSKMI